MKEYGFHFIKKDAAPEGVTNCMNFNSWRDIEQAKDSAKMFLSMMRGNYKRVDIYTQKGSMWIDTGEFVELSDI